MNVGDIVEIYLVALAAPDKWLPARVIKIARGVFLAELLHKHEEVEWTRIWLLVHARNRTWR